MKNPSNYYYYGNGKKPDGANMTFNEMFQYAKDNPVYNIATGAKITVMKSEIKQQMMMAAHTLYELNRRRLLNIRDEREYVNEDGITYRRNRLDGNHLLFKTDGWLYNTSSYVLALIIDYYGITGNMAGPVSQGNFLEDNEYRLMVADYLYTILSTFCKNNEVSTSIESTGASPIPIEATNTSVYDVVRRVIKIISA